MASLAFSKKNKKFWLIGLAFLQVWEISGRVYICMSGDTESGIIASFLGGWGLIPLASSLCFL